MKKIGLLCLALVLALGSLGIGYAAWVETLTIAQIVETGTVKVGVFGVAPDPIEAVGKDVANVTVTHGIERFDKLVSTLPEGAQIEPGTRAFYDSVTVAITNYYPSLDVLEDFYIGNGGTIPVKLEVALNVTDPDGVYADMDLGWAIFLISGGVVTTVGSGLGDASVELPKIDLNLEGLQLKPSDVVALFIDKHLQDDAPQGKSAEFTLTVTGVQWNLYS